MARFPTIEEFVQQVKERVLAECMIDGEPLGELLDTGDLVHVCRCKDCKWYGRADKRRFYRGMDCLQKRIDTIVPDKDYCSRAERKQAI